VKSPLPLCTDPDFVDQHYVEATNADNNRVSATKNNLKTIRCIKKKYEWN